MKGVNNLEEDRKTKHSCDGCCCLKFDVMAANRPAMIAMPFWAQATAEGELCGDGNCGHIQLSAKGLVTCGPYTVFFVTDKGTFPAGPRAADYTGMGYHPNMLVVNGEGLVSYYIAPLDFNPFKGIPTPTGLAKIIGVSINYHINGMTNGMTPGDDNVDVFDHLFAPMCYPRE